MVQGAVGFHLLYSIGKAWSSVSSAKKGSEAPFLYHLDNTTTFIMAVTKLKLSGQFTQLGTFLSKMDYCTATNHTSCVQINRKLTTNQKLAIQL